MKLRMIGLAMASLLAGCYQVGSLPGTQVEPITVEGRKFEVRLDRTGNPNEWRMEINRATIVVGPDYETEGDRAREVAKRVMERTCKGRPYEEILSGLQGDINYRVLFRCK